MSADVKPDAQPDPPSGTSDDLVPFRTAVRAWFGISLQIFGGPAGQIAVMHRTLVEEKRWIGPRRFQHALNYCTLPPAPQQLAIYVGWLLNGVRGGLVAGTLFVLPGVLALLALSAIYVSGQESLLVTALFAGLAPAVLAIVVHAVLRVAGRALGHPAGLRQRRISRVVRPAARRRATWARVRGQQRIRVRAMECRARLSWRSPPRLSRRRLVLPLLAGTGLTPAREARRRRCGSGRGGSS